MSEERPPLSVCDVAVCFDHPLTPCLFGVAAGLDSPAVYRLGGGGLDARQLADAGEELLLLLLSDMSSSKAAPQRDVARVILIVKQ